MGFTYNSAFVLGFLSWLMVTGVFIYYLWRRKSVPVREFSADASPPVAPQVRQL
jgi:hypothetical protein